MNGNTNNNTAVQSSTTETSSTTSVNSPGLQHSKELYNSIIHSTNTKAIAALEFIESNLLHYGLDSIAISFNGGKDCTVLLELLLAVLAHLQLPVSALTVLYFTDPAEFISITEFLNTVANKYSLIYTKMNENFITELHTLFQSKPIKAIFMGQRSSDPGIMNLSAISPSDSHSGGWPQFDRLNPLLKWNYQDIWEFIKSFKLDYCELYDKGYTSIGNQLNSRPNPALIIPQQQSNNSNSTAEYYPAYMLLDSSKERDGRIKSPTTATTVSK